MERLLASAVLTLALVAPMVAGADDIGPRHDIAAIRHDLPILLHDWYQGVIVDSVTVKADDAVSLAHVGKLHYRCFLQRHLDRWWLVGAQWACSQLPYVEGSEMPSGPLTDPAQWNPDLSWHATNSSRLSGVGYAVGVRFAPNDAPPGATLSAFTVRRPTVSESWVHYPSGNSYFFFSGTVQSTQPVHVRAGTTIDVWFPFVLDPSLHYSLTIAAPNVMSLGPVEGTLSDNTLHFVLPAFTAPPGADLMGEVASD